MRRQKGSFVCGGHIPGSVVHRNPKDKEPDIECCQVTFSFIVICDPQWEKPLKHCTHTYHYELWTRQNIANTVATFMYNTQSLIEYELVNSKKILGETCNLMRRICVRLIL